MISCIVVCIKLSTIAWDYGYSEYQNIGESPAIEPLIKLRETLEKSVPTN